MPIRSRDEMRRAISGRPEAAGPQMPQRLVGQGQVLDERARYMARMGARMGGGAAAAAGTGLSAAMTGGRPEGTLARLGGREVQWTKGDDGNWGWLPFQTEGQMAREGLASSQPAVVQQSVVAPAPGAPGLGAPAPVVSPVSRARAEALNTASQQAGGPNLSKPIVPSEAELLAQKEYAAAREANPLAAVPELLDQRSQAYGQRAGIDQWLKAMQGGSKSDQAIAQRFLDKQRRDANPVQDMPAGAKLMGGDGSEQGAVAYDAKRLAEYEKNGAPQQSVDAAMAAFAPRDLARNPLVNSALTPEGSAQAYQAAANGLELAPQATAQAGNLAFSPLPQANAAQGQMDFQKAAQLDLGSELLKRYKGQALAFNNSTFNGFGAG